MRNALRVLLTIAEELATLAKSGMPKLRKGETVNREWLKDGLYYRETIFNGKTYRAVFDFKRRMNYFQ